MKAIFYFLIGIFLSSFIGYPVHAQTKVNQQLANNFYYNCKAKQDPRMRPESQDAMCACASVEMMSKMSVEDIRAMGGDNLEARRALNKMLIEVYAPCMNYPLEDMIGVQCLQDKKIDQLGLKMPREALCSCVAEKTATWFVNEGRVSMRRVLMDNPNIEDPIGPIMESKAFQDQTFQNMTQCMTQR